MAQETNRKRMGCHSFIKKDLKPVLGHIYFLFFKVYSFLGGHIVCGILVSQPGIEPRPMAVKAQSLNHRITKEFPEVYS